MKDSEKDVFRLIPSQNSDIIFLPQLQSFNTDKFDKPLLIGKG